MTRLPELTYEPAWRATVPDWLLVIRATWVEPKLMAEAAAEIQRRNFEPGGRKVWLSGSIIRHHELLNAALVAEEQGSEAA